MDKTLDISNIKFSYKDIKRQIKIPTNLSDDVAYLSGILAGDGHISKEGKNDIKCGGNTKDEKEFYNIIIKDLMIKLFNVEIKPKEYSDGTYGFTICSQAMLQFFTKIIRLPRGKKYDAIKIPELFLQDKRFVLNFVRGLFDTDFGLCLSRKYQSEPYYPQVCFDSKSEHFAREIWSVLKLLGLEFRGKVYMVYDKDDRTKAGFTITYRFDLYGHAYFVSILKIIGLRHPKHLKKYEEWLMINKDNPKVKKLLGEYKNSGGWI